MYRLVHSFHTKKESAKKNLNIVKKKWADAYIEEDSSEYAVVYYRTSSHENAVKILHKIFSLGLFCGIQEVQ